MNDTLAHINYRLLTTEEEARAGLAGLGAHERIGLDTETFWDRGTPSSVSLVQIATPSGEIFIVDTLTAGIEALRPVVESPAVAKIAHNARFDEGVLKEAGLAPHNLIDTLQLARFALDVPSFSLKSVVAHLFGIELDKSFQKSNWARRPLSVEQLHYAALDARLTLKVFDELRQILQAEGRWELAHKAATLRVKSAEDEGKPKRRAIKLPPLQLNAEQRRVVAKLKEWRLGRARSLRVPAYMVCPDRTLEHLAQAQPGDVAALQEIYGLGEAKIARFGDELLEAVRAARE